MNTESPNAGRTSAEPNARQALWLQRMRRDLPAAARSHPEWPVRLDHCFARIILDEVCGGPWREHLAAPAWRRLSAAELDAAVALADAILAGRADLAELNRRSLLARRARRAGPAGAPVAGPRPSASSNLWAPG